MGLGGEICRSLRTRWSFNLPYEENREKAQSAPSMAERDKFCTLVANELTPWSERFGVKIVVRQMPDSEKWPWGCIEIGALGLDTADKVDVEDWKGLLRAADEAAATEIVVSVQYEEARGRPAGATPILE